MSLSPEARRFLSQLPKLTLEPGVCLFAEGDAGDTLYIILKGGVAITRRSTSGDVLCLARLGVGQIFGEMAVFNPGARTATATAMSLTRVAALDRATLLQFLVQRDPVARDLLRSCTQVVVRRLRNTRDLTRVVDDYLTGAAPWELDRALARLMSAHENQLLPTWLGGRGRR
ncbi:MAG: cyclic nucleotide-binding domain-containing protein [Alphaproteobacteria bacterium]|nr:cyclic nucleotide-binding domain-containing protein [Alphaproteobacteria bacterium]